MTALEIAAGVGPPAAGDEPVRVRPAARVAAPGDGRWSTSPTFPGGWRSPASTDADVAAVSLWVGSSTKISKQLGGSSTTWLW